MCCEQGREIDLRGDGGVICCDGRKLACDWKYYPSNMNSIAKSIIQSCTEAHEKKHFNQVPPCPCNGLTRPDFKPELNRGRAECDVSKGEMGCLRGKLKAKPYATDPGCVKEINTQLGKITRSLNALYIGCLSM